VSEATEVLAARPRYPLKAVCQALEVSRSAVYACRASASPAPGEPRKRGPKAKVTDGELLAAIKEEIADSSFVGEGYKKIRARLRRRRKLRVGKNRVLRLMRLHGLLAPVRRVHRRGDPAHAGTIITEQPDQMWGTDGTKFATRRDGWCWVFIAIDHCTLEIMGWHAAEKGDRWAALEPIRQGVRRRWQGFAADLAAGLKVRHDWGTQYTSRDFQNELKFLGIESSAAYVSEPETNGVAERFMRTLREQVLDGARFETLDEARQAIGRFIADYNRSWLIERHGYRTPAEIRAAFGVAA